MARASSTARGRPREFDAAKALDAAVQVFWQKGYEGASLDDLTRAMGINRPSMYAAFGDKQELFRKALDRYAEGPAGYVREALQEKTARAVVEKLLLRTVAAVACRGNPHGCLLVQGAVSTGDSSICGELAARRELMVTWLRRRFKRAQSEGDLPRHADTAALARYVATILHGLSVQASSGASRKELEKVVKVTMKAWPG
ncbi:MAG TPA: TetR/AcrR family transcriptional regulator [Terriglobales bacterium]|nr:TetR/AcrR family transcriptional regulator [Terriglobales bacterium]